MAADTTTASTPRHAEGVVLAAGEGRHIMGGSLDATVKMTLDHPALTSTFEVVIGPGFDVGAHVHDLGEEIFYIVDGELDLFAFEPIDRTVPDWHDWESTSGERPRRVGPGAFMFVPQATPHAFSNPTDRPTRVLFQSSVPGGHENYFDELMAILEAGRGTPDLTRLAELRTRYHIEELTTLHYTPDSAKRITTRAAHRSVMAPRWRSHRGVCCPHDPAATTWSQRCPCRRERRAAEHGGERPARRQSQVYAEAGRNPVGRRHLGAE